jgi:hypothetical protein
MQVQNVNNQQSFRAQVMFRKPLPEIYPDIAVGESFFAKQADTIIQKALNNLRRKKRKNEVEYVSRGSTSNKSRFRVKGGDTFILEKRKGSCHYTCVTIEHGRGGARGVTDIERNQPIAKDRVFDKLVRFLEKLRTKKTKKTK